ncbi:hypothetical protein CDAR_494951 [Caerostris darwini]|uniref:Uncharacterized protein n=1 Tax=Caerostris darwini TaxID=1538125 RepID=A0AAV4RX23_9ARAC|nr:hypothetical protein CDAR_494951 [Caerostris darwini]
MFGSYFPDTPFRSETGPRHPPETHPIVTQSVLSLSAKRSLHVRLSLMFFHHPNAPDGTKASNERRTSAVAKKAHSRSEAISFSSCEADSALRNDCTESENFRMRGELLLLQKEPILDRRQ